MENHDSDRILLIDDDPMVRLMAVLMQNAEEQGAFPGATQGFEPRSPGFADITPPVRLVPQQGQAEA